MATAETKKALGFLRELCDAVLLHLSDLDAEMRRPGPADASRGKRIAALSNRLEWANDRCRFFGLGISFRDDAKGKARETDSARHLDPWTERARIRRELLEEIDGHVWADGRDATAMKRALDEICPAEG